MDEFKIVVLTPVKNEEWILDQFLTITSLFADKIIIADQQSTDKSREICSKFNKVHLIENKDTEYDEAGRQKLLIKTARELFPSEKIIFFCLDADEVFSANSLTNKEAWDKIKNLSRGTAIYVEKPDLLYGIERCVRWINNYFPIGYVDDGKEHLPQTVHSKRIPEHSDNNLVYIDGIKILHFAHSRKNAQSAKLRYYSIIENIKKTKPVYLRRHAYKCFYNETETYPPENIENIPGDWLDTWDEMNINLRKPEDPIYSWHDFEVMRLFKEFGYKKFYLDNIWEFNWETLRQEALKLNKVCPKLVVVPPTFRYKLLGKSIDKLYTTYLKLRK
ncbi:glycosyltransferase family 2 protein [Chitinophagaceae bacterium LWZ2-11]